MKKRIWNPTPEEREKRRLKGLIYRAKNKEAIKERAKKRYEEDTAYKERVQRASAKWYSKNADRVKAKDSTPENQKRILRRHTERRQRNIKWVWDYKLSHPCVKCGESDPIVLQFHHEKDKEFNISRKKASTCSIQTLEEEIAKCIVLCSHCHLRHHHNERARKNISLA